jgi:ribonuclease T2
MATALLASLGITATAHARHSHGASATTERSFAYYLLSLSYAPDFCAQARGDKDPRECGADRHVSFVVHGLWPQSPSGRGPEFCGGGDRVPEDVIARTVGYMPTESLIQHEWTAHGTCTGLAPADYFAALRQARDALRVPAALQPRTEVELDRDAIAAALVEANPNVPTDAFRISCYPDGTLQEVRVCLTRDDLSPRACGASAGYCRAPRVRLRPVE